MMNRLAHPGESQSVTVEEFIEAFAALETEERAVITRLCEGKTTKQTSKEVRIAARTVELHRQAAMEKIGVSSIADLLGLYLTAIGAAPSTD